MFKVAVATSDGININEHFGQAREFRLYGVEEDGTHQPLEVRVISNVPLEGPRIHTAETTVEQLTDVDVVLASQIGPSAAAGLSHHGIKSFAVKGNIDRALSAYGKRHKFLEQEIPGVSGCRPQVGSCGCSRHGRN